MKGKALVGGIVGIACMILASAAMAVEPFDSKLQASAFSSKLVQAMDECDTPMSVFAGAGVCDPANVDTESGATFSVGKAVLKSKSTSFSQIIGVLKSSGNGANKKNLAGRNLRMQVVLRITKRTTLTAPTIPMTWEDLTFNCTVVAVPANGNFVFKAAMSSVIDPTCGMSSTLATDEYQKEVVSIAIIDADSGKAVAVPGVRKKPPGA
jgi:hypothetical protein